MSTRLTVRNALDNGWLDQCNSEFYFRDGFNSNWIRFYPEQTHIRDSGNTTWLAVDCTYDPILDNPCGTAASLASVACGSIPLEEAGSGNGVGSDGAEFNILTGYPAGYDLPDAGEVGFGVEKTFGTFEGKAIKRPGLDGTKESYTYPGTNSFLGHGTYENPAMCWTHTFSNGSAIAETIYECGDLAGIFEICYASYSTYGMSVDVYYLGALIASTCGRVTGRGKLEFTLDPAIGSGEDRVMIRIRSEEKQRWMYSVIGPKKVLNLPVFEPGNNIHLAQIRTTEYIGTSLFPAPTHSRVYPFSERQNNGQYWTEYVHNVGLLDPSTGPYVLHLNYETWDNGDWVEVYHGGERIASTLETKFEDGLMSIVFDPWRFENPVPDIVVKVMAQQREYGADIESYEYMLYEANRQGYKENRWNCEQPPSGITSAGHYSTEDHYTMNDIGDSVASVKVVGYGDFKYVASVIDAQGNVVAAKQGTGTQYIQWFRLEANDNYDDLLDVSVRIDCPIDASWNYLVGCYIPLLDIQIDDQTIDACPDIEININDAFAYEGQQARFVVSLNVPQSDPITVQYTTVDGTAQSSPDAIPAVGNPYPLYREEGIISSAVYKDETYNYTLLLEANPNRLYGPFGTSGTTQMNYFAGVYQEDVISNTDIAVNSFNELPPYYKMIANLLKDRFGTLNSSIKMLVLSHQRIWQYSYIERDDYYGGRVTEDAVYDMTTAMGHMTESLSNIYGITVDTEVINYYGPHGYSRTTIDPDSGTWKSHKDILNDYDIVVVDQFGLINHHINENSDISDLNSYKNKVFNLGQSSAFAVALSRMAKNSSDPKVIIATAGFSPKSSYTDLFYKMNTNAKSIINALGISEDVDIGYNTTATGMGTTDGISVQSIIDYAGNNAYLWDSMSVTNILDLQEDAALMSLFSLSTVGGTNSGGSSDQVDYQSTSGTLTIPAGAGSAEIPVNTFTDTVSDPNETFKVVISNPSAGVIGRGEGTGTILEGTATSASGDMNIVKDSLTSVGTALVSSTTYSHPETIVALKINANAINYSWANEGTTQLQYADVSYTEDAGSVAYMTMTETQTTVSSPTLSPANSMVSGVCAEFEFDPARTYEYKWSVTRSTATIPNAANRILILPYCAFYIENEDGYGDTWSFVPYDEYHANNDRLSIAYEWTTASTTQAGTAIFEVEIFVKDDLGNVQKSSPITVTIQQKANVYSGGGGGGCVALDTPILMADGTTKIAELLRPGDEIIGRQIPGMIDENTEGWEDWTTQSLEGSSNVASTVKSAKMNWYKEYWVINSDLKITQQHHILVKRDDTWHWLDVRDIKMGDKLLGMNGNEVHVGTLRHVKDRLDVIVIDVEENDTYYAGKNPVLVHNAPVDQKH